MSMQSLLCASKLVVLLHLAYRLMWAAWSGLLVDKGVYLVLACHLDARCQ